MANVQLENMRRNRRPFAFALENFSNPKEFQCMGFNLSHLDVQVKKGYLQVDAGYQDVWDPNEHFCGVFDRMMRLGPIANAQSIKERFAGSGNTTAGATLSDIKKGMDEVYYNETGTTP